MDGYIYQHILPHVQKLKEEKRVTLLLGTDRSIDKGTPRQETRVCITPIQVQVIRDWLTAQGISLTLYVMKDLGISSGYKDTDYLRPGDQSIDENELFSLTTPPDVVHALKEPCDYEAKIPGPFIRIGALHTGSFGLTSGCASLLKKQNFCGIFDGSVIGGFSYKFRGGYAIPIRSSMSVFAGKIAADLVFERNERAAKIVIVGGGVVGIHAAERILQKRPHGNTEIIIIEAREEGIKDLFNLYKDNPIVHIKQGNQVTRHDLQAASGLILAAFKPGVPSPKVVAVQTLNAMRQGARVIDVAVDEGGSIFYPPEETLAQALKKLGKNITYIGDTHLPRKYPAEASEAHGKAVLPYLATLLFLVAREGGATQAIEYIQHQWNQGADDDFQALVCDLGHGLAFSGPDPISVNERVVKDIMGILHFLKNENVRFDMC